jgi:threonine dehydrogenase-like Zn-dependent dehydrogenase
MHALTLTPGAADSVRVEEYPDPTPSADRLLVRALALGICGTDREMIAGQYGQAPPGEKRLILGHESLGEVLAAPPESGFAAGDLVVGIVRRPDPVPCPSCAVGQWDMCRNGRYTERGIKQLHGYGSELWTVEPGFAVKVEPSLGTLGVLLEPASVVAKAWQQIERIGARAAWTPRKVLVTGAGPIGLLAALMGVQRGYQVHVLDRVTSGPKPALVADLGATYHHEDVAQAGADADIVLECTGAAQLVFDVMTRTAPAGIVCLTGVSSGGRKLAVDLGALNRTMVLENDVVFGSVNANREHYHLAATALAKADRAWLSRLITRRLALHDWPSALDRIDGDVKTIIDFSR